MVDQDSPSDSTPRTPGGLPPDPTKAAPAPTPTPIGDSTPPPSSTMDRLLHEMVDLHARHDDHLFAANDLRWREGGLALQLTEEFEMSGQRIADAINARAGATARTRITSRWVQRLVEVQRVFPRPEARVEGATWKSHGGAYDVVKIQMGFISRKLRALSSDELERLMRASRALVVDALRQENEEDGIDADQWIGVQRSAAIGAAESREIAENRNLAPAGDGEREDEDAEVVGIDLGYGPDGDDEDEAWMTGGAAADAEDEADAEAGRPVFADATEAINTLVADDPTLQELNYLISLLKAARRKLVQS